MRVMLAFTLVMFIYITVLIYGVTVMRGVMEEKQSRIIEVLLASVRPFDLMLGSTGDRPPTQADVDHFFASTWRYFETADRAFAHPTPIQGAWTISGIGLSEEILAKLYRKNAENLLRR